MKCPNCEATVSGSSTLCPFCGTKIEKVEEKKGKPVQPQRTTCPYCNNPINENTYFCPSCGNPVTGSQPRRPVPGTRPVSDTNHPGGHQPGVPGTNHPGGRKTGVSGIQQGQTVPGTTGGTNPGGPWKTPGNPGGKKGGKIGLIIAGVVGLAIFLIVGLVAGLYLMKPSVDLNKYTNVYFTGYNQAGYANYDFDTEGAMAKMSANKRAYLQDIIDSSQINFSRQGDLSNGDEVTVSWNVDQEKAKRYGIRVKNTDQKVTVDGLTVCETFDPFEDVSVGFAGTDGNITAYYNVSPEAEYDVEFAFDKEEGLSIGDTVTLYVQMDQGAYDEFYDNYGKVPAPASKSIEITENDVQTFVMDYKQITADCLKNMENTAYNYYNEQIVPKEFDGKKSYFKGINYIGNYFLVENEANTNPANAIWLVYKVHVYNEIHGYRKNSYIYWAAKFDNIRLLSNGVNEVDYEDMFTVTDESYVDITSNRFRYTGYNSLQELYSYQVAEMAMDSDAYSIVDNTNDTPNVDTGITTEYKPNTAQGNNSNGNSGSGGNYSDQAGIIFSDSSQRYLSSSEISGLSNDDLQKAINEIYARNGYTFADQNKLNYYKKYSWYKPTISSNNFTEDRFNSYELANVHALQAERDRRK